MIKAEQFLIESYKLRKGPFCHPVEETFCRSNFEGEYYYSG
jgi:hypothetical protein